MPKKSYQTEVQIYYGKASDTPTVTFVRYNETVFEESDYTPGERSFERLSRVINAWSQKGWLNIQLVGRTVYAEVTL